jgi:signal-transduction protein with cAMP-binding, CBS, and nucleotidyltransferase domain
MPIGTIRTRDAAVCRREISVSEAAKVMRKRHVGTVVIVDEAGGRQVPCGIVTDRDIVIEIVAKGLDPESVRVGDMISGELTIVRELDGVAETVALMRAKAVRRLPVVDATGTLIGIVTADDVLQLLSEEMSSLAAMITREQRREVLVRK